MRLTDNDRRVLAAIEQACDEYDGYAPHGSADWTALRRLVRAGLVECSGWGVCDDCDSVGHRREPTEGPMYKLTSAGLAERENAT